MLLVTYNKPMFTSAQRMNATIHSTGFQVNHLYAFSIQAEYTGTPTGTLYLECSCDPVPQGAVTNSPQPTNWTTVATSPIVVEAAGNYVWNCWAVGYTWVRLSYTDSSGGTSTAMLTATFNGK